MGREGVLRVTPPPPTWTKSDFLISYVQAGLVKHVPPSSLSTNCLVS